MLRNNRSNCCQAPVHLSGDDGTKIYVCNKCQNPCDLYHQTPDMLNEEIESTIYALVYEKLPIKATEIGWEKIGEDVNEATSAITTAYAEAMNEVIGPDNGYIATDDLISDHKVSFAIQRRLKTSQRQRLQGLLPNGKDE